VKVRGRPWLVGPATAASFAETPKVARLGLGLCDDPSDARADQLGLRTPFTNGDPPQALGLIFG
jgi:hypothetical protein